MNCKKNYFNYNNNYNKKINSFKRNKLIIKYCNQILHKKYKKCLCKTHFFKNKLLIINNNNFNSNNRYI